MLKNPSDLPRAVLFEQLAEEATELAHAAQKMARKLRGENPTPVDEVFLTRIVHEEYNDVLNSAEVVGLESNQDLRREKMRRWIERLNANF